MRKKYLSILVACTMLLTSVPTAAFAEEAAPVDAAAVEAVAVEEDVDAVDAAPVEDASVTAEVSEPAEQVLQDAEASDETAEYPVDELLDAEAEQPEEDALAPEVAGETDEAFVDESGLIEDIEVVEEDSVAEVVEAAEGTQGTLGLNGEAQTITLNAENNYTAEYTLGVDSGSYIMAIKDYKEYSEYSGVSYTIFPASYDEDYDDEGSFSGNVANEIYCSKNSTIKFKSVASDVSFNVTLKKLPSASDAKPLALNTSETISLDIGSYKVYSFKPTATGRYTMYMDGQYKDSFLIELRDSSWSWRVYDYNGSFTYSLKAGSTYYYVVQGGYDYSYVGACTMHFIQTPTVTGATLTAMPTKREFVKKIDSHVNPKGMKVKLVYSNGSTKEIECGEYYDDYDDYYYYDEKVEDDYGNYVYFKVYDKDIKGNTDYGTSLNFDDEQPSGVYDMGAEVYTYSGNRSVLFTRITVPFTIVDKDQHIHIWGAWTNTATGQTRKCELCGKTETKSKPASPVLELTANKLTMKKGQSTKKFKVTKMNAGDSVVSVKSSDAKVLKVSNVKANGTFKLKALKVTGKKKVKLTVTLASGLSKTVNVTIQNANVKTTKVKTDKKLTLKAKKKAKLKSVITPVTSQDKVKYKSSNTKVATVNAKGVVTAKKPGKAKITVQAGSKRATCTVTVQKK